MMSRIPRQFLNLLVYSSTLFVSGSVLAASLVGANNPAQFPPFRMEEYENIIDQETFEEPDQVEVPRVSDRVYDDEEQQRLPVEKVEISEVVPFPDRGITHDQIQALIDQRFEDEQAIELDDNGFTVRDLGDIGRYLRAIADRGGVADKEDMDGLMAMIRRQEFERGWITVEQLDAIAQTVTEYYRQSGFILATAYIPEQEVSDGVIVLKVLEGRLGEVAVANNNIYEDDTIKKAFSGELGNPVTEEQVEGALRRINDLPGVRVRGSFAPGENVGETRLTLGVLEEENWRSNVLMDNHGSETTGEVRLFGIAEWFNLADRGHRLLAGALRSEGPDAAIYGLFEYELPVTANGRGSITTGLSRNTFSVGPQNNLPEIVGETDNFSLAGKYQFVRSRTLNLAGSLSYVRKDVLFQVGQIATLSTDQKIEVVSAGVDYTRLWDRQQFLLTGRFSIDQGHMISGEVRDQSVDFTKLLLNANLLKRFSIQNWLTKNESFYNLVFKVNGQYADKFLSSVEQLSLGGPNAVRAFSVSDVSVDSGLYFGTELFFDLPFDLMAKLPLDPIRPFIFFDYAYGVARTPAGTNNRDAQIKAYGIGFRVNWQSKLVANFILATPKSARYDDNFSQARGESRVYIDVTYQVH